MTSSPPSADPADVPALTVVVPLAGQDMYVDDLLASIPAADGSAPRLELVFVVAEGGREEVAAHWASRDPRARVVEAESDRTVDVRRAGLDAARGTWVLFPQADSVFGEGMLTGLQSFLAAQPAADVVALNTRRLVHHSGAHRDTHQGRWRFADGDRTVDLRTHPEYLQLQFESAVIRTEALRAASDGLRTASTGSDDVLALADVLARGDAPLLGLAAGAVYFERVRSHADRDFARFRADAQHYLARAELAEQLTRGVEQGAAGERWRSWAVVAEAASLLRHEVATPRRATALDEDQRARFVSLVTDALRRGGPQEVDDYAVAVVPPETRAVLRAWAGGVEPQRVRRVRTDERTGQSLVRYNFVGDLPDERYLRGGEAVTPDAAKVRAVDYFGQRILRERIAWVAPGVGEVVLDGVPYDLDAPASGAAEPSRAPGARARQGVRARVRAARRSWLSRAAAVRALAKVPGAWRRFDDAWVLMDRADLAGDNAEHLYRWLREHRPETNAWFVLREDSPDFARLQREGFRLMPYGSVAHQVLLHHATEYLSSHAGVDVLRPMGDRLVAQHPSWRFTFLQHGVIHNDLSIWLNNQRFDLFVASTHDEYEGIVGDDSPYMFTAREVKLVGMPRYDSLRRLADARPWAQRRTILVAPTWRNSLFLPAARPGERRQPRPDFAASDYVTSLAALLGDDRLRALAEREGLEIVFLPHPNIGEHFPRELIPAHVRVTSYAQEDVQQLLADARVFLTDYSSVAFDAAYADAAVVYLQTDAGSIFGGDHTLHPGYFRFEEHGFGPVCVTAEDATDAVLAALQTPAVTEPYRARTHATFAWWDGGSCQRLVELIESTR